MNIACSTVFDELPRGVVVAAPLTVVVLPCVLVVSATVFMSLDVVVVVVALVIVDESVVDIADDCRNANVVRWERGLCVIILSKSEWLVAILYLRRVCCRRRRWRCHRRRRRR